MKKFIALLISASLIAAPVAFADDQSTTPDQAAAMQKMSGNDQVASHPAKSAKKKARCHHCKCHHGKQKKHVKDADKNM